MEILERDKRETAVLAAADTGEYDVEASLSELTALCDTAGADVAAEVVQRRVKPDPGTYLGAGKLAEAKLVCENAGADVLVVDAELSAAAQRNIEDAVGVPVVDRTTLILDIFAQHAVTAEGKLQVELAQQRYRLVHLTGEGTALSRLGGGIGTRGPGESKLESDRRHIRTRIAILEKRLAELEKRREQTRQRRKKSGVPLVSLAGYTNVGKSSLLNALTDSQVLSENKLFATLDPTARRLSVGELQQVILVDTVGLVSRLPHSLVQAFRSTLEEIAGSDLIILVADASDGGWPEQLEVAKRTIEELGCADIPFLTVFNKCDLIDTSQALPGIRVSARTGEGLDELRAGVSKKLSERVVRCEILLPFDRLSVSQIIRERGNVLSEEYTEKGLRLRVTIDRALYHLVEPYAVTE